MTNISRRSLLAGGLSASLLASLPPSIARAVSIAPDVRSGTIRDVEHVVILMQENRSFDHYFGTLRGVRGFGDRFPIPLPPVDGQETNRPVWQQYDRKAPDGPRLIAPFHLSTHKNFDLMRMEGTTHGWPDAQAAWDQGRMANWPEAKTQRAMGHFRRDDIPFQFALAEAFTLCDAYHCSVQTGTNTNRLFLWTGTNDPSGAHGGPAIGNSHDNFPEKGGSAHSYLWTTVAEQLQAAGIDWQIYQDMADNFTDNPLAGFESFRAAYHGTGNPELKKRGLSTHALDALRADVQAGRLPQISYIVATATGSEHPGPSSPAQGAAYTAEVLDALTSNPAVWARTALFINFDENDGFFDHVPPPAPPSRDKDGHLLGGSSVDLTGEYHLKPSIGDEKADLPAYRGRPYGLGPRVPMYVVSPWSRGGWVNSQTFDHSSVVRFLEERFGFTCPNISPWRRAVCGDLTSAFDFASADGTPLPALPDPREDAARAAALKHQISPMAPSEAETLYQEPGTRPSRPLPYHLEVSTMTGADGISLHFSAEGAAAVFHVYDRTDLNALPRRYTVAAGKTLEGQWPFGEKGDYDLQIFGPNGFHRRFAGNHAQEQGLVTLSWQVEKDMLTLTVPTEAAKLGLTLSRQTLTASGLTEPLTAGRHIWPLAESYGWYDVTIGSRAVPAFERRLAGRFDLPGRATISDPFA